MVVWMVLLGGCERPVAPLTHEIYIWQRVWNPGVREAAVAAKGEGLIPLVAWQEWPGPRVKWAEVPWRELAGGGRRCAAIRVEPWPRSAGPLPVSNERLAGAARECVRRAAEQGVDLREIQLDFDAAESQLAVYAAWVAEVRTAVAPVQVTFTALPCWLNQPAFSKLAHSGDGYVLQVHAAEKPTPASTLLCDPAKAQRWVRQAARVAPGVPFRVALPTYTYELAFGVDNTCLGVVAEGEARAWPEASRVVFLKADPASLADLLKTWNAKRPSELTGVLWFRLPVASDAHNWRMSTLQSLIRGETPRPNLSTRATLDSEGRLCDLSLVNSGDADAIPPPGITVRWKNARMESGEALAGYAMTSSDDSAVLRPRGETRGGGLRILRPGQSVPLGWLRFSDPISAPSITLDEQN